MPEAKPYPKSAQLGSQRKRYRRRVASAKQWAALWSEKIGPCRVCATRGPLTELHHLVFREDGGDDVAENLVPLCSADHAALHNRATAISRLLLSRLSDAEYAYMIERGGEDYPERAYGIVYARGDS